MSEFSGTIESINMKDTKTGGKYISIKLKEAQTIFGCFEPALCEQLAVGDKIKLIYKQTQVGDRTYYNIQDIQNVPIEEQSELPKKEESISRDMKYLMNYLNDRFSRIEENLGVLNRKIDSLLPEPKFVKYDIVGNEIKE